MLIYPASFPLEARDKVEARKVREGFRFNRDKESVRWNSEMGALRIRYVLRIWRVFVAEAARLHLWHLAEMDFHCRQFLRLLTIDVGDHGLGSMVNHVSGGILPEVQRQFERSAEWRSFQAALLAMAKHFKRQPAEPGPSAALDKDTGASAKDRRRWIDDFKLRVEVATQRKITRKDIALAAGYHPRNLQNFQNGKASSSVNDAFSRILKTSPEEFVRRLDRKPPK